MKTFLSRLLVTLVGLNAFCAMARAERPFVLQYAEGGNWYAHLLISDSAGWPDTLEKRGYGTESQARERVEWLKQTTGAREVDSTPTRGRLVELRNPQAGEVWTATEGWSSEWENRYAEWTRENFDATFFSRYGVATDCADAAIALRWIFARIHGLPAGNRLAGNQALVTNRSIRSSWSSLPQSENWFDDQRFRAALDYVLNTTYTHSLLADAFPLQISSQYIREGVFHLEMRSTDGHTRVISRIHSEADRWPIDDLYSNVPRVIRDLYAEPFTVYEQPSLLFGGLVGHRWVVLAAEGAALIPGEAMPGYSLEQYQPDFFKHVEYDFSAEVATRLQVSLDPVLGMSAVFKNLSSGLSERKNVVEAGYDVCKDNDCSPGTENFEYYSTPSRDRRIGNQFRQIEGYLTTLTGDALARAQKLYAAETSKPLLELEGRELRYPELREIWKDLRFTSDPSDPIRKRWGQE